MANIIIDGSFPDGLDLNTPVTNPVTITGTIELGASGQGGAVQGETVAAWNITNQGSILGGPAVGIDLLLGGMVTNDQSALVSGLFAIEIQGNAGNVTNAGTLDGGASGTGVDLTEGGSISNLVGGLIQSGDDGVTSSGSAAVVTNAGIINAGTGAAIDLLAGGNVTNEAGGTLTGDWGISIQGATSGSVLNDGIVAAGAQAGVFLTGGSVTNQAQGTISGTWGISIQGASNGSVLNDGMVIGGTQSGVFLTGGTVTNQAGGTITGNWGIADTGAAGTVITGGTIIGTNGTAVTLPSGFANLLVDDPGAVIDGVSDGGNSIGSAVVSTLELGAASLQGTLSGLGTNFIDFGSVVIDPGASWTLSNANTLAAGATLTNQGTLLLSAASLVADGTEIIGGIAGATASLTVTKAAALSGASTLVDGGAGTGSVVVNNQGLATVAIAVLGASADGSGSLDVSGVGSGFSTTGSLTVGQVGGGRLTVENQATVQAGGVTGVGMAAGAIGEVTVTGTQSLFGNTGSLTVGGSGFGNLAITAGGTVTTTAGAVIASTASASGSSVNISGTGSNLQVGGALLVGSGGFGALSLSQGATVAAASLDAGTTAGSGGNISLSGTGTALNLTGNLIVGDAGNGNLSVLGGASIKAANITLGLNKGASGVADIEGNSVITVAGTFDVGGAGNAVLSLGANTFVNAQVFNIGTAGVLIEFNDPINTGSFTNANSIVANGGQNTITATSQFINNGPVEVSSGATETITTPKITGTGSIQLSTGADVVLNTGSVANTQTVIFEDGTGTLTLGGSTAVAGFNALIQGFTLGDQILLSGIAGFSDSLDGTGQTLTVFSNGTSIGALDFSTAVTPQELAQVACFAAGTLIETVDGPRRVESLDVGDEVVTLLGGSGRIVWVGSRAVDCARHPRPEAVWPVRIAAGAFGPGVPRRELFLSPDHAVYVNNVLVPVKLLVNGTSIVQMKRDRVTYYHVELPEHAVILAEGLTVESYLDTGDRANFGDGATTLLFPDFAQPSATLWETRGAAELVTTGSELEAVRRMVSTLGKPRAGVIVASG